MRLVLSIKHVLSGTPELFVRPGLSMITNEKCAVCEPCATWDLYCTLIRPLLSVITVLSVSPVLLRTPTFVMPVISVITALSALSMSPVLLRTLTFVMPVLSVITVLSMSPVLLRTPTLVLFVITMLSVSPCAP